MDCFESFMFAELESLYAKDTLEGYEYRDIYERFLHLGHLPEVKPYLYAMRFLGRGTQPEPDAVLKELEAETATAGPILKGLFYDMKQAAGEGTADERKELKKCVAGGYCGKYLQGASCIRRGAFDTAAEEAAETDTDPADAADFLDESEESDDDLEPIVFKSMSFEGGGRIGNYFASGEVDYLSAKVFIEPVKTERTISVRSQIFENSKKFSEVFSDEVTLKPGDTWFKTDGWGNKNHTCYKNRVYEWRVEIDGRDVHSEKVGFYNGAIEGVKVKSVRLFSPNGSVPQKDEEKKYASAFDSAAMESIYFAMSIENLREDTAALVLRKVVYEEDDSVLFEDCRLQQLNSGCSLAWNGWGYSKKGRWKKGMYRYHYRVEIGSNTSVFEGTFTVY